MSHEPKDTSHYLPGAATAKRVIDELTQQRDWLQRENHQMQAQLNAAKRGMDSAAAAGRLMMEKGQKLAAENSLEAIESERKANAMLTAENEALQAEVEQLKKGVELRDQQNADLHGMIADIHQERDKLRVYINNLRTAALSAISFLPRGSTKVNLRDACNDTPEQSLAAHDAKAIERAINECAYKTLQGDIINVECIREYANQLRQQAQEAAQ